MDPENLMMQGILLFPPQGVLGQLKKTWHKKFCLLFNPSKVGIKRLEIYDSQDEVSAQPHSSKIITLEACIKITPINQPHVFTVVTKTGVHHFGCCSESEMTTWINAFQTVAFKDTLLSQTIEENNDLYCTSGEGIFAVKLVASDASKRCGLQEKNYTLIIATADMKLMDGEYMLYMWPYRFIRRYGYRDGRFTFEAGRKCDSGEGSFHLEHNNQQEIFRCLSTKMKCMKKLLSGDSSPTIECNNAQYHAAMSMEAGSRSPLPPSPNSSANLVDMEFSTISQNSQKQLYSSSSLESISFIKPPPPIVKPKPAKPPRKHMFTSLLERKPLEQEFPDSMLCGKYTRLNSSSSSEFPSTENNNLTHDDLKNPYDSIEIRNNAWKTHGVDNVPHTEMVSPCSYGDGNEGQYEAIETLSLASHSSSKSKTSTTELTITPTCPIIRNNVSNKSDPPNYDKLQHFGSTHKLNHNSAYRTPNIQNNTQNISQVNSPLIPAVNNNSTTSWDNYDFVEDMCAVRLADDSSHGYGMIRKKSIPPNIVGPNHKIYNETEYAIISKPRRV
ncbi:docking protein 2 [Athalia rosae]|uniref:docking protein 2 n=1 Tax=Athalia rosae TaxID=37344 RepID=UPI0020347996|nr:docking protein 2 [Athalia rosae]